MKNKNIIENFTQLIKQTEEECFQLKEDGNKKDANVCQFKIKNYKKGLDILKSFPDEINNSDDIKGTPGIGKGMLSRIEEILETGKLKELKKKSSSKTSKLEIINQMELITGVGPKKAHKLYEAGFTLKTLLDQLVQIVLISNENIYDLTVDEIMEISKSEGFHIHNLTHHQIIGLKYFHDINQRIPRSELTKIETKLKKYVAKIDEDLIITVCGSYRRGLLTSGDIDVLITHPDLKTQEDIDENGKEYLINIINKLTKRGLLIDHLTTLGTTKYMGVCRLTKKSKGRRIDIRFVARNDYAPALLYFTGSKNFNQKMRAEALKKGYTINEYGIYRLQRKNGNYIHKKGDKITVKTERDIFKLVGMEYLKPHERL